MFWNQMFFIQRHISVDTRNALFDTLIPPTLAANSLTRNELWLYFDKAFTNAQVWFRTKIKEYGEFFLTKTPAGQAWRLQIKQAVQQGVGHESTHIDKPESARDLLEWQGLRGLEFTKFHTIDFYRRYLVTV
jgi:hypothetical protein